MKLEQATTNRLTPRQRCDLAAELVPYAVQLAATVRDGSPDDIQRLLWDIPAGHMPAFAVVLAAMIDVSKTPAALLDWVTWDWAPL